ncbi:MAG: DUF3850 domain-containing protein [Candidatus Micrarchaeota archaeon]
MRIEKKIWPKPFEKILTGEKTFELRLADWKCNVGDVLVLKEWNPAMKSYTGRQIEKTITYILKTKDQQFFSKQDVDKYGFQVIALK